jgi:DNA polymerase (family 10)
MINERIVQIFEEIGDMLEILGENVFRVRAYQRAAEVIRGLSDLEEMHKKDDKAIEGLPGIGKDLHAKIIEIITTGECEMHARLLKQVGPGMLDMLRIRGIGPKKVKLFRDQLGITNLEQLKSAAESGALATLPGMGEKSEAIIVAALRDQSLSKERIPYAKALETATAFIDYLKSFKEVKQIQYGGSLRRKKATVGDIDLLVTGTDTDKIMQHFAAYPKVRQLLNRGDTKSSVVLEGNLQVDLRVVDAESFGAALFYFTGPKHFNIHVRTLALKRGWKINEYGLYEGEEKLAGKTEEEMFEGLGMPYMTPEERENFK